MFYSETFYHNVAVVVVPNAVLTAAFNSSLES